ncbi:unnamed protein product [Rotaria sordida]|uniref:Guanine nucleotide-binding protein G(s) subunit alpha n=2 Tax=Rotaria sordida TaxID=392033 RepID=A0A814VP35_9BILA|nr:unnamed protein product [Rotaria sordida]
MASLCDPFTQKEKIDKIPDIKRYIRDSLSKVLRAFDQSIPPVQLEHPENHWRATYILTTAQANNFDYPSEFYEHVAILWADAGVQLCLKQSMEQNYSDIVKYFLDLVNKVKYPTYIPSITHHRVGFHLFEMDLRHDDRQEWIEYFRDVIGIIFVVDCSCFNLITGEDRSQNRLQQSLDLFKTIRKNEWLRTTSIILLLNKQDLLAKQITNDVRLEDYFPEFHHYVVPRVKIDDFDIDEDPKISRAKHFIHDQFLKVNMVTSAK